MKHIDNAAIAIGVAITCCSLGLSEITTVGILLATLGIVERLSK